MPERILYTLNQQKKRTEKRKKEEGKKVIKMIQQKIYLIIKWKNFQQKYQRMIFQ